MKKRLLISKIHYQHSKINKFYGIMKNKNMNYK